MKEREEAMAASNFFEDLQYYKKTIGLSEEADLSKTKKDVVNKEKNVKKIPRKVKTEHKSQKKNSKTG